MGKLLVSLAVSLDGYGAGPNQSLENPLGVGGPDLHQWLFPTDTFQKFHGDGKGEKGIDNDFAARYMATGATIMGRNMFGPFRGPWPDDQWKGWWGNNPPFHTPVYVLTHFGRPSIEMEGGTSFHFVTEGPQAALQKAKEAAKGKAIRIGGGIEVIRKYLELGLVDEMHMAVSPILLGKGENLLAGLNLVEMGYRCTEHVPSAKATHVVLTRKN